MHVYPWRNLVGFHNVVLHDGYMHRARRENREFGLNDDYTPWLREKLGAVYADHNDSGVGCNGYAAQAWPYHEMLHPTSWVTSQGIDFLRRRDTSKPFFLTLSYHRPHPPLDPPASFLNRYLQKDIPPPAMGNWVDHELRRGGHDSPIPRGPSTGGFCPKSVLRTDFTHRFSDQPHDSWHSTNTAFRTTRPYSSPRITAKCSTITTMWEKACLMTDPLASPSSCECPEHLALLEHGALVESPVELLGTSSQPSVTSRESTPRTISTAKVY